MLVRVACVVVGCRASNVFLFLQLGAPQIYNPNALPMYRDESVYGRPANKRKRAEMEEAERRRRKQPEMGGMPKGAPRLCLPVLLHCWYQHSC